MQQFNAVLAAGVTVKQGEGVKYIDDYQVQGSPKAAGKRVTAVMCAEIGGMNGIEPLFAAAESGLPVIDCDLMGRAFPELQVWLLSDCCNIVQ